ncbi:MAG: CHAT domain-containing protein, partial [Cyanobacteria bacterium P01_A01_bin.83]
MFNYKSPLPRSCFLFLLTLCLTIALTIPVHSQSTTLTMVNKAQQLYQAGELSQAVVAWQEAAAEFEAQGDRLGRSKSLINQSQVLQNLGLYPKACRVVLKAFDLANPECNSSGIKQLRETLANQNRITTIDGIGLRSLGNILQHRGMLTEAEKLIKIALLAPPKSSDIGATLLTLGNIQQTQANQIRDRTSYDKITEIIDRQDPELALEPYQDAIEAYQRAKASRYTPPITKVQAQLNHLSLLIEIEAWWQQQTQRRMQSWQRFEQTRLITAADRFAIALANKLDTSKVSLVSGINDKLAKLPPTHQAIYAKINYAQSLSLLQQTSAIESILQTALHQAQTIDDQLGSSYALGYLGKYYGQQGAMAKAIAFTNQALAIAVAQNINSDTREISYLWQSQLGQLLEQEGKTEQAIAAYTLAFNTLQSLRTDLNANSQVVQFNFIQDVKPVYMRLANLLLTVDESKDSKLKSLSTLNTTTTPSNSDNLELARQVIESLQLAELDNFFQDPCSQTADVALTIDDLDPQAAVIYPIVFNDRLEVILSLPRQPLQRFVTEVSATKVNETLDVFYDSLYNRSINNSAVNILSTTPVNPTELLENTQVLLPTLEEIYGWLIKPWSAQLAAQQINTLVFVLNGRLQNVPMAALYDGQQYLLEKYSVALAPSLQLLDTKQTPRSQLKVLAAGLSEQVEIKGEIFPALANVPQELAQIKKIFPQSRKLLNQEFTASKVEESISTGFPIVHLATHGVFSSDPEETFIITGDRDIVDLNFLNKMLTTNKGTKPELIVLSACDTATGDERAVLGLAGVAVRSGSSTVGSLWSVEDTSTTQLMSQFYRQLENPDRKKVDALQQAQLSLIDSLRANPLSPELQQLPPHPYYWASYVMVGNWQ